MRRENHQQTQTPLSVLLVEDAAQVRQRLRELITEVPSLRVAAEACTVSEAKALFDAFRPGAVLLDLALLGGSGTDVLKYIRNRDGGRSVVIILSNYLEPEIYNHCSALGADFLFNKSDEFEQAIETLHALTQHDAVTTTHAANARKYRVKLAVTSHVGMHARPAAMLVKQAQAFDADIDISHQGNKTSAKSILGILTLCAEYGAKVTVTATGPEAQEAIRAITQLFASGFEEHPIPGGRLDLLNNPNTDEFILVVDDNTDLRTFIKTILEKHGYRIVEARNGVEAVALLTANTGDIKAVILDMIMPDMDGSETMSVLRRMNPTLPVLAISGVEEQSPFKNNATTMFLKKPFGGKGLHDALQTLLDQTTRGQSTMKPAAQPFVFEHDHAGSANR